MPKERNKGITRRIAKAIDRSYHTQLRNCPDAVQKEKIISQVEIK
ncbi:MAG: hypothetical protein ACRC2S_07260 [Waterburya sp.]